MDTPKGGWGLYDIHHIKPLEFGGVTSFENMTPIIRGTHQTEFNTFWRNYGKRYRAGLRLFYESASAPVPVGAQLRGQGPTRLASRFSQPASVDEIKHAWPDGQLPSELTLAWGRSRESWLFEDTNYGQ